MPDKCHLLCLPTEMRIQIYKYLIPEKHTFILTHEDGRTVAVNDCHHNNWRSRECISTALFCVSKQIYRETRELLFGPNTFVLRAGVWVETVLNGHAFRSDVIGLSRARSIFTVATLQRIQHLEIQIYLTNHIRGLSYKRIHGWLCELASAFEQGHSLKTLKVRCILGTYQFRWPGGWKYCINESELMARPFILETLVPLSGIKNVTIEGVDPVFAAKLGRFMMVSEKRKLKELDYPKLQYKRRKVNTVRHVQHVKMTTRKYYDPQYDWDEVEANSVKTE